MRLFFAINFQKEVKDALAAVQNDLRRQVVRGNFTLYENLHLTLVFIGEVHDRQAERLVQIAEELEAGPFVLRFTHLGRFKRDGGDLIWAGMEKSAPLLSLYEKLAARVQTAGFSVEERAYKPHLTLARAVRFRDFFSLPDYKMDPLEAEVTGISLMKSERLKGRLTYTELRTGL